MKKQTEQILTFWTAGGIMQWAEQYLQKCEDRNHTPRRKYRSTDSQYFGYELQHDPFLYSYIYVK